jgi:hypothetical protein
MGFSTGFPGNHKWLLTGHAPYEWTNLILETVVHAWPSL